MVTLTHVITHWPQMHLIIAPLMIELRIRSTMHCPLDSYHVFPSGVIKTPNNTKGRRLWTTVRFTFRASLLGIGEREYTRMSSDSMLSSVSLHDCMPPVMSWLTDDICLGQVFNYSQFSLFYVITIKHLNIFEKELPNEK